MKQNNFYRVPVSHTQTLVLTIVCLLFINTSAYCIEKDHKWGKVSKEEINLKTVPFDAEAHAVVLAKTGKLAYFNQNFKIHIYYRIKILDSEGVSEGDIKIPYYSKDNLEKIDQVKAQTLEIMENGKVVEHRLDKDQVFDAQVNENWSEVRFAMPAVKPGTILEYSYTLTTSNFTFLEGWTFQDELPALYSYYKVEIPHFLTYNTLMQGSRIYQKYQNLAATNEWELENLPALKWEPYTYNLRDYAEKIQFQLHSYTSTDYSGLASEKEMLIDWNAITKKVLTTAEFGNYTHTNKPLEEILQKIPTSPDSLEHAKKIYAYIQKNYTWNTFYGLLPDRNLKELLKEKSGNSTSLNLLLVSLLRKAGFQADPIFLSTKTHGWVNPKYPILSQFNHLNAIVQIGKKEYVLNAAGNPLAFGLLPVQDLNQRALVLSTEDSRWIELKDFSRSYSLITYNADLTKGDHTFLCSWRGFKALEVEKDLQEGNFNKLLILKDVSIVQDSVNIVNSFSTENELKASFYFSEKSNWNSDKVFFDLSLPEFFQENPFKNEKRLFPVDFGYAYTNHLIYSLKIPENYTLQEQPENILLKLPDGSAAFYYHATLVGNQLNIQIKFDIVKSFIPQEYYLHLRELFSKMINHCQQPYVFVKVP